MQEDPPGMELLQVDCCQQSVEDAYEHDDEGKGHAEAVQQLVCFVLLCKRPNVEDKNRVSVPYIGG